MKGQGVEKEARAGAEAEEEVATEGGREGGGAGAGGGSGSGASRGSRGRSCCCCSPSPPLAAGSRGGGECIEMSGTAGARELELVEEKEEMVDGGEKKASSESEREGLEGRKVERESEAEG